MRTRKAVKRGSHVLARLAATESRSQLNLFCRHPWLLAWPHATNLELSAARPPTLRVCARAVRATRRPRAHGSLPYGQPSASVGLRIRAYSSPLRGLLPAACSARPTPPPGLMQGQRGRVVSVRHARPAAHTLRAVVRSAAVTRSSAPVQSISQRGRQRLTAAATQQPPHATGNRLTVAPPATDSQQRPPEAVPEPRQPLLRPPNSPAPQRAPAGSWQPTRCHMPPRTPPHLKTASPDGRRRPSRYNCSCNRPPKARRAPWPCPPP